MKRVVIQTHAFSRELDQLIDKGKLLLEDFEDFETYLIYNPQSGDVVPGLNGIRKTRLKSSTKGKRGGFRVDYLDIPHLYTTHLIVLYSKNVKDDLSSEEKKILATIAKMIKEEAK